MDGPVLERKSCFKMMGLFFSSKLDWGSYLIPFVKTYLCKSIMSFTWNAVVRCGLVLPVAAEYVG